MEVTKDLHYNNHYLKNYNSIKFPFGPFYIHLMNGDKIKRKKIL